MTSSEDQNQLSQEDPSRSGVDADAVVDPDGDPGELNPRDLRGVPTGDGAADDGGTDADADPEVLNPRRG